MDPVVEPSEPIDSFRVYTPTTAKTPEIRPRTPSWKMVNRQLERKRMVEQMNARRKALYDEVFGDGVVPRRPITPEEAPILEAGIKRMRKALKHGAQFMSAETRASAQAFLDGLKLARRK